jgi:hypothetical protein
MHISCDLPCLQYRVGLGLNFERVHRLHFLLCAFLSRKLFIEVVYLLGEIICDIDDILELILHAVQAHHLLNEFFDILEDTRVPPYGSRPFLL